MSEPVHATPSPSSPRGAGAPDFVAIKQRQQATWASGDFARIGVTLQMVGESLAEAADVRPNENVIDVAAGNGNATLAAAHRFAIVTSTDFVPALLDKGRARAAAEDMTVTFREADAEALPFADACFDVALSTFGAMFAPDQERCAGEMLRVVRPGGRIGLANWTPDGFIGQLFKTIGKHVAPPAGLQPPSLWGTEERLAQLFGSGAQSIRAERKLFNFRYASPEHWMQMYRDFYGPVRRAFAALDVSGALALERDVYTLLGKFNTAGPGALIVPAEYLEVVIVKREADMRH